MDGTWATSAAKLSTRVVLPDQFQVLLDHCRRPTRGHPTSLQGQLQDDASTAQSLYRHLHEAPDLLGVGGVSQPSESPWQVHPRPSPVNSLQRYIRRSDAICQSLSTTLSHAGHVLPQPATSTIDINGYNLARSRKLRNIADNGRAAFVVDDLVSVRPRRVRCLEIRGVAEALSTEGGPLIRLHPKRIISFVIDEPDTEAHSLTTTSRNVG